MTESSHRRVCEAELHGDAVTTPVFSAAGRTRTLSAEAVSKASTSSFDSAGAAASADSLRSSSSAASFFRMSAACFKCHNEAHLLCKSPLAATSLGRGAPHNPQYDSSSSSRCRHPRQTTGVSGTTRDSIASCRGRFIHAGGFHSDALQLRFDFLQCLDHCRALGGQRLFPFQFGRSCDRVRP